MPKTTSREIYQGHLSLSILSKKIGFRTPTHQIVNSCCFNYWSRNSGIVKEQMFQITKNNKISDKYSMLSVLMSPLEAAMEHYSNA